MLSAWCLFCRCGHCQQLKPVWNKLASSMKGRVNVGAVDCTASQSVCQVLEPHYIRPLHSFVSACSSVVNPCI